MFENFITSHYFFIKTIHIIAIISWMAGLLYLPRIFVYHTRIYKNKEANELFKLMERKLLKIIMLPAMIISLTTGIMLIYAIGFSGNMWLHVKITFVIGLLITHGFMIKFALDFTQNKNSHSEKFYRVINEVPTVLMIIIVALVTYQGF